MLKSKRFLALLMVGLLVVVMATGCGSNESSKGDESNAGDTGGEEKVKIIFANITSKSGHDGAELFKEIAEAESNGTLEVTVYPDNQLGDDRAAIEATQSGDIDIGVSSTSPLASMYADFYIFDAPYLFLSSEQVYDVLDGEVGQEILKGMEKIGLKGLTFWENGFRNFTNNDKAVRKPEDLKNLKIRTMENDIHLEAWKALGANPTPMAFQEVFTALQQGTVDGQENPLGIIDANKFEEVQKNVTLTQHVYTPYIVTMNLDKYNSLTDVQKAAIDKAAKESTKHQREASKKYEQEILDGFEAKGVNVIELTDDEKAVFQKVINDANIFDLVRDKMDNPQYLDKILK